MPPSCALFGGFAIGARLRCYGSITRTRNVSEYMLVLALCLVFILSTLYNVLGNITSNSAAKRTSRYNHEQQLVVAHHCTLRSMRSPLLCRTDDAKPSRGQRPDDDDDDDGDCLDGRSDRRGPEVARQDSRSSADARSNVAVRSIIDASSPL